MPDGDFLDLAHAGPREGPSVLILHGLEGNLRSHYALGLLRALERAGYHGVFLHFRNCGDEPNRLPRGYHSGETGDLQQVLEHLRDRSGQPVRAAVGISLGTFRIVTGTPLYLYILVGYAMVAVQTILAPKVIVPLAYDSGGVTTSTVTVPLVTALGLGIASNVPDRSPILDGFGLIAFASLFPIISVLGYAQFAQWMAHRKGRE